MSRKIIPVALLSSLTLSAGLALATEPAYPSNPERSFTVYSVPLAQTRAGAQSELADFRKNPISGDGWQYVGGEREWAQIPHKLAFVGGKFDRAIPRKLAFVGGQFAHTDECDHSERAKPDLRMSAAEQSLARELYRIAL